MTDRLTTRGRVRAKKAKAKRVKVARKHVRDTLRRRRSSDDLSELKMAMVP